MNKNEQKEYKVLARKYRPQVFSDLIGQETLVLTLKNSIIQNRIAHAYLLTGVRGIGKTTTARLIAMSLNCQNRKKDSCEPCGQCDSCVSIREDRSLDVIEMDAASKTGVDDIREIIDNVKYKPVNSKYKIFIIDEVHMLSKNAFNALLKTLEEPPEHVKFIFATTEVKKIPITIISRCQRFDLHRIDNDKLNSHLLFVIKKEHIKADNEAIALIARVADGSMRDGLSLLDQAISIQSENINSELVTNMLGLADKGNIFDLMESIFNGDANSALKIYKKIHNAGADVLMIFDEMLNVTHFITQLKIAPELKNDVLIPEMERKRGFLISEKISMSSLGIVWQVLFKGFEELQSGYHLFQHGEMIIIRLIYLYDGPSPDDLIKKEDNNKENNVKKNLTDFKSNKSHKLTSNKNVPQDAESNFNKISDNKKEVLKGNLRIKSFREFVNLFYQKKEAMIHANLYNNIKLISFKEGELTINATAISDTNFSRSIAKLISTWTGRIWQISLSTSNIGKTLYEEDLLQQQKAIEKMKNEKEIKNILDNFPGTEIHSITSIDETNEEKESSLETKQTKEK